MKLSIEELHVIYNRLKEEDVDIKTKIKEEIDELEEDEDCERDFQRWRNERRLI